MTATTNKLTIWRASLRTPHFFFEATGLSDAEAFKALRLGFEEHARQYHSRIAPDWWREFYEQIALEQFDLGAAYRDGELLK